MNPASVRVVKVGGSLFDLPDFPDRLRAWLARQSAAHQVLVAGGGGLVDQVRRWHAVEPLDEVAAHWMCIDLLTVTAHLLLARLPEFQLIEDDRLLCQRVGEPGATLFGPAAWLRSAEPGLPGDGLPASWDVTSDAIAGRLAIALGAQELVLLKSALPEPTVGCELDGLAAVGYLDPFLATLGAELPSLRLVNLRSDPPEELTPQGSD